MLASEREKLRVALLKLNAAEWTLARLGIVPIQELAGDTEKLLA
jgi:hypothetical protein